MSVTDKLPTKVGQRVQDMFVDTRGWIRELGERNGLKVAVVAWDNPAGGAVDEDDSVFPVDALRVVTTIVVDSDVYLDPSTWSEVEQTTTGTEHGTVYRLKSGTVIKGEEQMRAFLLGFCTGTDGAS